MKKSLGLGLDSLLEDISSVFESQSEDYIKNNIDLIEDINVNEIIVNPFQPRKEFNQKELEELSESIEEYGLLQPIVVITKNDFLSYYKDVNIPSDINYCLVSGERRFRAIQLLGLKTIKTVVFRHNVDKIRELALIENIQRKDLNPIEIAIAYESIMKINNLTQEELSNIVKKSRSEIANTLRLLKLSENTKKLIIDGRISTGHAKIIAGDLKNEKLIVDTVIGQKLNVRECEKLVKKINNKNNFKFLDEQDINFLNTKNIIYKLNGNKLEFDLSDDKTLLYIKNSLLTCN